MRSSLALLILFSTLSIALGAPEADVPDLESAVPLFRDADRADYPDADAVILLWEQEYRLLENGGIRRRDHKVVKLFDARVNREFADPRIDFEEGREEVKIFTARTILPGGEVLPVPDYAFNIAAPNDVAGWPEYAAWRQKIVSFSGIRPGAIVELHYEIVTAPGVQPRLNADLVLAQRHPVLDRRITVMVPRDSKITHLVTGPFAADVSRGGSNGREGLSWHLRDLPAVSDEPHGHPRRHTCGRLAFSVGGGALEWVKDRIDGATVKLDERIMKLGKETAGNQTDPLEASAKVAALLKGTLNLVRSPKARRSLACRPPGEVLRSGYGNEVETAVLAAALLKAVGFTTTPAVAVDEGTWLPGVPLDAAFSGALLRMDWADTTFLIDPLEGPIRVPASAPPRLVLDVDREGGLRTERIGRRGEEVESLLVIRGALTLDKTGKLSGKLTLSATGSFYDPKGLGTPDAQKAWLGKMAAGVATGVEVRSHSVQNLSDERFQATMTVEAAKPFLSHGDRRVLRFGEGPLFPASFPLPLLNPDRRGDVLLTGRFREQVHITVKLPDGWSAATPDSQEIGESWGHLRQRITSNRSVVTLDRMVRMRTGQLLRNQFEGLRIILNRLRTPAANSVVVGP